ncbi:hypothetical protein ACN47E_001741 [Coniothyrium glycines]
MLSFVFNTIFLLLILPGLAQSTPISFVVRHDSGIDTVGKVCERIRVLTALNGLASNQTALDNLFAEGKMDQKRKDWLEGEASNIASQLNTLNSNVTLTNECATVNAQRKVAKQCKRLKKLKKLAALSNNQTALDEHLAKEILNQKQVEQLRKSIAEAPMKLQRLQSDSTLVALCNENTSQLQQNGAMDTDALDNTGLIAQTSRAPTLSAWAPLLACANMFVIALAFTICL